MNLFSYLEEQGRIISRNNNSIKEVSEVAARLQQSLQGRVRMKFDDLDRQFEILSKYKLIQMRSVRRKK
jgi:hypothetical protein